ncbi:MAG: flavodoxin [Clostridia bacterium]|nr:flavodoxin [Clostridia bacterium]
MKKCLSLFLCFVMLFAFSACAKNANKSASKTEENAASTTQAATSSAEENPDGLIPGVNTNEVTSDTLICYFSCTGNTAQIASYIKLATGGDLFEIIPKSPYTKEDLDYNASNSRTENEYKNEKFRPEISSKVSSWSNYKTVYIGYPIWYGEAPRIIYTFLDTYDCSGKTVIPFCTSASSSIDGSIPAIKNLSPNAKWQNGIRFDPASTEEDVAKKLK